MSKSAKKRTKSQQLPAPRQPKLQLTEFVRQNLMIFIIHEDRRALDQLLEQERTELCGPACAKGTAGDPVRWGHTEGRLVMGGQRVIVRKPRVRQEGKELTLPAWADFADEDPLNDRVYQQLVLGVSDRGYQRSLEPLPDDLGPPGATKSSASRRFVETTSKKLHRSVGKALRDAFKSSSKKAAKTRVQKLARQLQDDHPDAAASLKEGLEEILTVKGMGLPFVLEKMLSTTNAIENLNGSIRDVSRKVKHWRDGAMIKRWVATGILEAELGFYRVKGFKKGMPVLIKARSKNADRQEHDLDQQQVAA